jgi:hypothetical protein
MTVNEDDVLWLKIPVNYAAIMGMLERVTDGCTPFSCFTKRSLATGEIILERDTTHELAYDIDSVIIAPNFEDLDDIRMTKLGCGPGLAKKQLDVLCRKSPFSGDLDRDGAI